MTDTMRKAFLNQVATHGNGFEFSNEFDLVRALNKICRMIALGDETRFVMRDDRGAPRFLKLHDAKSELAQYQLVFEKKKKAPKGEQAAPETEQTDAPEIAPGTPEAEQKAASKDEKKDAPEPVYVPAFAIWLKSADRTPKYERRIFNPNTDEVGPNDLNLWTGFAVDPAPGDWSLLRDHIRENVCNGNEEHFRYLMGWLAQLFQDPGRKIGVAVVLRGKKGVGKSKLSDCIRDMIGPRHAMVADRKEQWTGRFTKQLEQRIFLGCEEALFAGSHEQDSAIKNLITQEDFSYEGKFKDVDPGKNFTRVFITSNEEWTVPATSGERRFFVLDVGDKHAKETKYFAAIDQQMREGGSAAMLHDLLEFDYSEIDLRNPPVTDALNDQIEIGLKAPLAWLASALSDGHFPFFGDMHNGVEWADEPEKEPKNKAEEDAQEEKRYVLKSDVFASYRGFVPGYRDRPTTPAAVGKFLAKQVPGIEGVKKRVFGTLTPHYRLPLLTDARKAFLMANPGLTLAGPDRVIDEEDEESSSNVTDLEDHRHAA